MLELTLLVSKTHMNAEREEIKRIYGKLFDDVVAALFEFDPMHIDMGSNADEYELEAQHIIPRLKMAGSAPDVSLITFEVFTECFGIDRGFGHYDAVAEKIWLLWCEYKRQHPEL